MRLFALLIFVFLLTACNEYKPTITLLDSDGTSLNATYVVVLLKDDENTFTIARVYSDGELVGHPIIIDKKASGIHYKLRGMQILVDVPFFGGNYD